MSRTARLYYLALAWILFAYGVASADGHAVVPGFERFFASGKNEKARGGRLLLSELNCLACHATDAKLPHKQAPVLDRVGSRVRVGYLRRFLRDPQSAKPGTTMPALFVGDPERDQ